jgi:TfoX/Sxy family transcriptional regulator of competence genes
MASSNQNSQSVAAMFEAVVITIPETEHRKMFGWTCVFIEGNMLSGFYQDQMMLRLSDKDRETFLELPNTSIFNPKGDRPMREYVNVPMEVIVSSKDLENWFNKGFRYVAALPPKAKKVRTAKPKAKQLSALH